MTSKKTTKPHSSRSLSVAKDKVTTATPDICNSVIRLSNIVYLGLESGRQINFEWDFVYFILNLLWAHFCTFYPPPPPPTEVLLMSIPIMSILIIMLVVGFFPLRVDHITDICSFYWMCIASFVI